jgi:hypothetical protein
LIPEGEANIVAARAPAAPQVLSQQTNHGDSGTAPSIVKLGSVHSAMKLAKIWDFMALRFSKSTMCFENPNAIYEFFWSCLYFPKCQLAVDWL